MLIFSAGKLLIYFGKHMCIVLLLHCRRPLFNSHYSNCFNCGQIRGPPNKRPGCWRGDEPGFLSSLCLTYYFLDYRCFFSLIKHTMNHTRSTEPAIPVTGLLSQPAEEADSDHLVFACHKDLIHPHLIRRR